MMRRSNTNTRIRSGAGSSHTLGNGNGRATRNTPLPRKRCSPIRFCGLTGYDCLSARRRGADETKNRTVKVQLCAACFAPQTWRSWPCLRRGSPGRREHRREHKMRLSHLIADITKRRLRHPRAFRAGRRVTPSYGAVGTATPREPVRGAHFRARVPPAPLRQPPPCLRLGMVRKPKTAKTTPGITVASSAIAKLGARPSRVPITPRMKYAPEQ